MVRKILKYPEDKDTLSLISEKVESTENITELIQDLKDTLLYSGGKGISAIQIGIPKQVCICSWSGKEIVMINPVITRTRGVEKYSEGCLSVPGIFIEVERAQKVWCTYLDENKEIKEIAEGGRMSDIIQHELDHFNGKCAVYKEGL